MARRSRSPLSSLSDAPEVRAAAGVLVDAVRAEAEKRALAPESYEKAIAALEHARGRPLMFPTLAAGPGSGARLRLADGRVLLDFASGIGVHAFGHGDRDLLETAAIAAAGGDSYQGHLVPGPEYARLSRDLRRAAGSRLRHVWLSVSGADANENALKMIFQKHAPADRVVVFERGFHGRTGVMQELTDRPGFREGQPERMGVLHVPFFDPRDEESTERSLAVLDAHLRRHPGRVAAMCFELVQGEGGFRTAPREFFLALMERCRRDDVAVWVDEVQTFARTGDLFAFQTLDLVHMVDVVSVGKQLQGSAVLMTRAYNPKPGLVAGTYAGSTVGMAVGGRILERLHEEGYLGPEGRVAVLGRRLARRVESLRKRLPRAVGECVGLGAMQAFVPFDGSAEAARAVCRAAFEEGLLMLSAGGDPAVLRFMTPLSVADEELEAGFALLEKALRRVAEERGVAC